MKGQRTCSCTTHELGGSLPGSLYIYTYVSEKRGSTPKMLNSCPRLCWETKHAPNRDPHLADMIDQRSSSIGQPSGNHQANPSPTVDGLPEFFMTEIMGGRVCHCTSCGPQFELDVETKMIRRLTREKKAELSAATQARTESDFRKEKQAGIRVNGR